MKKINLKKIDLKKINLKKINFKLLKLPTFKLSNKNNKVITLFKDYMYVYEKGIIVKKDKSFEKGIITSSISFKDTYNISFKLSKALDEEELLVEAEKYVYSQDILDLTKEYKIIYNFQKYDEYYYVDAFAAEVEKIESLMADDVKIFKYIDFISFSPFAFEEYYDLAKVTPEVDVFIYLGVEDAYIVGFNKGKFVFVRSIDKLKILEKELNKPLDEILKILKTKGLDKNNYEDEYVFEIIDTYFSKLSMKINNVINYSVNFFKLNKINKIFFYSPFDIFLLEENYKDFWSLSNIKFKLLTLNVDYDPFEYIVSTYNAKHYSNEYLNFSVFQRPPPIYKRPSGGLVFLVLAGVSLIVLDAAYKEHQIAHLKQEKMLLELRASSYKNKLNLVKTQIKFYNEELKKLNKKYENVAKEANQLYNKVNQLYSIYQKPFFTNEYAKIVDLLEKYNLKVRAFHKINKSFNITILSSHINYNKIPLFLKDLKKEGFSNIYIKQIDNNSTSYHTKVFFDD